MWEISKQFEFDFGHRVWSQNLISEFSLTHKCACRHLHGHRGYVTVTLTSDKLEAGMVTDFNHLNWFKTFLNETLDHKFLIDKNDPMIYKLIFNTDASNFEQHFIKNEHGYWSVNHKKMEASLNENELEIYESFIVLDFVPTSENISKWLFEIVDNKMSKLNIKVSSIEFFESPKSKSKYVSTR